MLFHVLLAIGLVGNVMLFVYIFLIRLFSITKNYLYTMPTISIFTLFTFSTRQWTLKSATIQKPKKKSYANAPAVRNFSALIFHLKTWKQQRWCASVADIRPYATSLSLPHAYFRLHKTREITRAWEYNFSLVRYPLYTSTHTRTGDT